MLASDPAARTSYDGTMGTAILKAFDLAAACTGLNETQAEALEIPHRAIIIHAGSHASYYPGSRQLSLKLVFGTRRANPRRAGHRRGRRGQAHRRHRDGDQSRHERAAN